MTPNEIKTALTAEADAIIAQYGGETVLTQDDLDSTTDSGVTVLNTINPNTTRPVIRS